MSDYEYEHTVETAAAPEAVWALWADVATWSTWDASVIRSALDGAFEVGGTGTMEIEGPGAIPFVLIEVEPGVSFLDETVLGEAVLRFDHRVEPRRAGGSRISMRITVDGPGAADMGPMVTDDTAEVLEALARRAESVAV
jgi:hypothetical protein